MRKIKNILILAGGDSIRFWPLSEKNLINFLGQPLIQYQVENLKTFADKITIVSSRHNLSLMNRIIKQTAQIVIQNEQPHGQAGAIISAKEKIEGETLIVNANDIFNNNVLTQLINKITHEELDCLLTAKKIKTYFPGGYLQLEEGKLKSIIEKPAETNVPSNIVRLVIDYFSDFKTLIKFLETAKINSDDLYEQGINFYLKNTKKADYILYNDYWFSLKYPWHVLTMMKYFLNNFVKADKIDQSAKISKKAIIIGPVIIGKNVKIGDFSKIVGPCFVDDGTIIGDYAMVRESQISKNSLIGGYCEVTRSYLGNNVSLHRNYIGDSVLDDSVEFGAGAVTANFRLDKKPISSLVGDKKIDSQLTKFGAIIGKGSKIGVNTTILPGMKIGKNTFVGSNSLVTTDLVNNGFFFKNKISKNSYKP